ncbi:MAG: AarF/ABC1/UbiB kinase family protein [Firmicutes bacterium]|nr:AarF/ABC1/UbiB kinase family protein [Alicyclobacillaceae bacterium]MCL6496383.1 AarF/ABC1/UbiB kinase family protein [Bacillota bacterium]
MKGGRPLWERYRQVAEALARQGFGLVVDRLGLATHLPWPVRWRARWGRSPVPWPERVRQLLVELGPVWVKLGQLASLRADLFPAELVAALADLQDAVEPFDNRLAWQAVEAAWGRPVDTVLARWDLEPLASASVAQVYGAELRDGRAVVVKVRRPDIVSQAEADLALVRRLAEVAERRLEWARELELGRLVDELVETLRQEFDFRTEARNTQRAAAVMSGLSGHAVPEVIESLSGPSVLVTTRLGGTRLTDREGLARLGFDPASVARRFVLGVYHQVFGEGFFHADPHPGNVHLDPDGTLVWLDWGLAGRLDEAMRQRSVRLILALTRGQAEAVADALIGLAVAPTELDRAGLTEAVDRLRRRYYEARLDQFQMGEALWDLLRVARRFRLRIPTDYALLAKTAVIADGVVRQLDPRLSLVELGQELGPRLWWSEWAPHRWASALPERVWRWGETVWGLPYHLDEALRQLGQGAVRLRVDDRHLDYLARHWEQVAARITAALLLGAITVGLGLVVASGGGRQWPSGWAGWAFACSGGLGAAVVLRTLWRGHL